MTPTPWFRNFIFITTTASTGSKSPTACHVFTVAGNDGGAPYRHGPAIKGPSGYANNPRSAAGNAAGVVQVASGSAALSSPGLA